MAMDSGLLITQTRTVIAMKGSIKMIRKMDTEFINGKMEPHTKDSFLMI